MKHVQQFAHTESTFVAFQFVVFRINFVFINNFTQRVCLRIIRTGNVDGLFFGISFRINVNISPVKGWNIPCDRIHDPVVIDFIRLGNSSLFLLVSSRLPLAYFLTKQCKCSPKKNDE
ncbi:hypothetical protein D3C71_898150 [compost metagenome]